MKKIPTFNSQKNSVNSSFSTVKNFDYLPIMSTANKKGGEKRFSYQQTKNDLCTLQKENMRLNFAKENYSERCLNHQKVLALYIVLGDSDDPMFLCDRCAILVASKGFQINKIKIPKVTQKQPTYEFKKEVSSAFSLVKQKKNDTLQKLNGYSLKLDQKLEFLEQYFFSLHQYIQKEKNNSLKEIYRCKRQLQNVRTDANKYFVKILEEIKQLNEQNKKNDVENSIDDAVNECRRLKKCNFEINPQDITCNLKFINVNEVGLQISNFIRGKSIKSRGWPVKGDQQIDELKLKCEVENSSIRSLQLSFEEENNFTLNNYEGKLTERDSSSGSNLLN